MRRIPRMKDGSLPTVAWMLLAMHVCAEQSGCSVALGASQANFTFCCDPESRTQSCGVVLRVAVCPRMFLTRTPLREPTGSGTCAPELPALEKFLPCVRATALFHLCRASSLLFMYACRSEAVREVLSSRDTRPSAVSMASCSLSPSLNPTALPENLVPLFTESVAARKGSSVSTFQQSFQKRPCHAELVVLDPESGLTEMEVVDPVIKVMATSV